MTNTQNSSTGLSVILVAFAMLITWVIFKIDMNTPRSVAVGAMYSIVIVYSWILRVKYINLIAVLTCTVLIVIAAIYSPSDTDGGLDGLNIGISLLTVWISFTLLKLAKNGFSELEKTKSGLENTVEKRTLELIKNQILIEKKEKKYKELLQSAPDPTIIANGKGVIELVNLATEKVFGYSKEEIEGQRIEFLLPDRLSDVHKENRNRFFKHPKSRFMGEGGELLGKRKSGEEFPVEISLSPIETENGILVSASIRDITERKQVESEVNLFNAQLQNKNKELEQFVYIASHDLQEPLRTLSSVSYILREDYHEVLDDEGQQCLTFINESTLRMKELIQSLLEYGRIGKETERQTVNCNHILDEIKEDLKLLIDTTSTKINSNELPSIQGYPISLRVLFQNIISNAIKYRKKDESPEITISSFVEEEQHIFYFKDNGIGIEPASRARIFQIFQRLHTKEKYDGSGIGLAHCLKVVELHGGSISVEGEIGKGSTFIVKLPKF